MKRPLLEHDGERIAALDLALQECLLGKDLDRRGAALGWLSSNSRWLDLSLFEHTLMRLDDIESFNPGKSLLDRWELARSPKMHRLAVYREAIFSSGVVISGGVVYGRADRLTPSSAIAAATWDGIYELKEDILRRYEGLAPEVKRSLPVERILIELGSDESATVPADPFVNDWKAQLGDYAHHGMARHNVIMERRRTQ